MAEKSSYTMGQKKSMFCFFWITSFLFFLSWLFVLRSTRKTPFIEYNLLPNPKLSSVFSNGNVNPQSDMNPSTRNVNNGAKRTCNDLVLKVFMYDLPPEFHFGLLGWTPNGNSVWPDIRTIVPQYPGGLNLQHSIEYWLVLDLLLSEFRHPGPSGAVRVLNSSEADVIFVPFFSSLCYNRNSKLKVNQKRSNDLLLQQKLVEFLVVQEEWKRSGGLNHIVMAHHPNSLIDARMKLWPATYILSDFGRYPPNVANVDKDVIAPYKHIVRTFENDSSGFDSRPTLMYFQGAIYRKDGGLARQELFYLLKDERDVHFSFGSVQRGGVHKATEGMRSSKFCLNIAGDTPSSNRLFDAIASHCVPIIISDDIELPYEDVIDYSEFCVFVPTSDALKEKFLVNLIRGIGREEWTRMWQKLKEVEKIFEYQYPSQGGDAVQMIWKAIARKVPAMKMKIHRLRRFSRYNAPRISGIRWNKIPVSLVG